MTDLDHYNGGETTFEVLQYLDALHHRRPLGTIDGVLANVSYRTSPIDDMKFFVGQTVAFKGDHYKWQPGDRVKVTGYVAAGDPVEWYILFADGDQVIELPERFFVPESEAPPAQPVRYREWW